MKLFQSGQSCVPKINCNRPQHFSVKLTEKETPWRRRASERQRAAMKSPFESQPDIKLAFLYAGRERKWGELTEERWGGQAASQRLACSGVTCRGEPGRHLRGTARAGNRSLAHMWASKGTKIECKDRVYTITTAEEVYAHRRTHWAGDKVANGSQGWRGQKSARRKLILPMWSLQRERAKEAGKQFNLREDWEESKPINTPATARTVNMHY